MEQSHIDIGISADQPFDFNGRVHGTEATSHNDDIRCAITRFRLMPITGRIDQTREHHAIEQDMFHERFGE